MLGTVDLHDPQSWKVHMAVIQPTPFCNINCRYCYLPGRNALQRMTTETVEQAFRFLFREPQRLAAKIVVAWHAGEPLTMPLPFYEFAFDAQKRLVPDLVHIENSLQTNAILIDQVWCDFFKRWNVKVGVSLDGPAFLHDANRVDRYGRGTYTRVMRGIDFLRANGIDFSIISVLSEQSLGHAEEIWRFYRELGVKSIAFNCEDVEGNNVSSSLSGNTAFRRVQAFFQTLLRLRAEEDPSIAIRELDSFLEAIPYWREGFRKIDNVPLAFLGIAWNGNVSTFSPELIGMPSARYGDFVFGNVAADTLNSVLANPKFLAAYHEISDGIQECRAQCDYFRMCGGGQPSSKISENGTFASTETLSCQLNIQAIGSVVLESMENSHGLSEGRLQPVRKRIDHLLAVFGFGSSCIRK